MSIGKFPESLSQAMLVGVMLVGRLGVVGFRSLRRASSSIALSCIPCQKLTLTPRGNKLPKCRCLEPGRLRKCLTIFECLRARSQVGRPLGGRERPFSCSIICSHVFTFFQLFLFIFCLFLSLYVYVSLLFFKYYFSEAMNDYLKCTESPPLTFVRKTTTWP